jgi:hypothetical protein
MVRKSINSIFSMSRVGFIKSKISPESKRQGKRDVIVAFGQGLGLTV